MPFVWVYYLYLQVVLLTLTVHRKLAGDSKLATSVSGGFFSSFDSPMAASRPGVLKGKAGIPKEWMDRGS